MRLERIAVALLMAAACGLTYAQSGYEGQIRGTVTDPAGAAVPGATVRLTNNATGIAVNATTDMQGLYTFNGVRPATYTLLVSAAGFTPFESKDIVLAVSQQAVINARL